MVKPVLAEELAAVRAESLPEDRDAGIRGFEHFTASLHDPGTALALLSRYPALVLELLAEFDRWTSSRLEFVTRLVADLPQLRKDLGVTAMSPADVEAADFGAGDAHNGGRTVAVVSFREGPKVVYKPRSLACDAAFAQFVDWLGAQGLRHLLRPARVVDRGTHGWSAHYAPTTAPTTTRYAASTGVKVPTSLCSTCCAATTCTFRTRWRWVRTPSTSIWRPCSTRNSRSRAGWTTRKTSWHSDCATPCSRWVSCPTGSSEPTNTGSAPWR